MHRNFQVSTEMFDRVQDRVTQTHSQTCLLRCLGCVLRVIVLLEGEPSPQSEVLGAPEQVYIKELSVTCAVHLSLKPDLSPSHCR